MISTTSLKRLAFGLLALSTVATTVPAIAQGIEIGPNGVRVLEPRGPGDDRRMDERIDRRDDRRDRREISERQAVRIARGEGLRNVDDIRRTRSSYRIFGSDRRGRDIRVTVDRRTGDVLGVR